MRAFLTDLLIVTIIIALLVGFIFPAIQASKQPLEVKEEIEPPKRQISEITMD